MNTRDNIQAELQRMSMEIVRLTNEKTGQDEYVRRYEEGKDAELPQHAA